MSSLPVRAAAGSLMIDLQGTLEPTANDLDRMADPVIGGVILFSRNYADRSQLGALIAALRRSRPEELPALLLAVDYEGGRVQRFREGFTRIPAMARIGSVFENDPQLALGLAFDAGLVIAAELIDCGIDLSLAPVLDVLTCNSDVIGDRSFGRDGSVVAQLAERFIAGMDHAGMRAVAKHFPGHGGVSADSHLCLPEDRRILDQLRSCDLIPYRELSGRYHGVMTAHVLYPSLDDSIPTYSRYWIHEILRGEMGFDGIVFSDDLSMAGASGAPVAERFEAARDAGCDIMLICNDQQATQELISQCMCDDSQAPVPLSRLYSHPQPIESDRLDRARRSLCDLAAD